MKKIKSILFLVVFAISICVTSLTGVTADVNYATYPIISLSDYMNNFPNATILEITEDSIIIEIDGVLYCVELNKK